MVRGIFLTPCSISHVLSALMRVDDTCREVVYQLAMGVPSESAGTLGDDAERTLEARLALFRKMVSTPLCLRHTWLIGISQMAARTQANDGAEQEVGVEVNGWVKLGAASGWKECPIGYWRG